MFSKTSLRGVGAVAVFMAVLLGLMSMVGQVHVGEFYGCLGLGFVAGLVAFFQHPKPVRTETNSGLGE